MELRDHAVHLCHFTGRWASRLNSSGHKTCLMVYRWLTSPQVRSFQTDDCVKSSPNYKASIQIVRTGYRVLRDYGSTDWFQNGRWKGIVVTSMLSFIRFRCALYKCPVWMYEVKRMKSHSRAVAIDKSHALQETLQLCSENKRHCVRSSERRDRRKGCASALTCEIRRNVDLRYSVPKCRTLCYKGLC